MDRGVVAETDKVEVFVLLYRCSSNRLQNAGCVCVAHV